MRVLVFFLSFTIILSSYADKCSKFSNRIAKYKENSIQSLYEEGILKSHDYAFINLIVQNGCATFEDFNTTQNKFINSLDENFLDLLQDDKVEAIERIIIYDDSEYSDLVNKQIDLATFNLPNTESLVAKHDLYKKYMIPSAEKEAKTLKKVLENRSCSNKRNDANLNEPRDQDTIGWCFAFLGADLLSHKLGREVSASDIGISAFKTISANELTRDNGDGNIGISVDDAVNSAINSGLCYEENFPSEDFTSSTKDSFELVEVLLMLDDSWFSKDIYSSSEYSDHICNSLEISMIAKNLSEGEILGILNEYRKDQYLTKLRERNCLEKSQTQKELEKYRAVYSNHKRKIKASDITNLLNEIDNSLDKDEIIGISYSANVYDKKSDRVAALPGKNIYDTHASSIVGRRMNPETGKCQYLVRNTWGPEYENSNFDVENGSIWIDSQDIALYTFGTTKLVEK